MISEKIAFSNQNYVKVMMLNTGSLRNIVSLIRLGFFQEAEKMLIQYHTKTEREHEELLLNLQMLQLYKKLLNLDNSFDIVTKELSNENIKRKDIMYANIALASSDLEEAKGLLRHCIENFGSDLAKRSFKNDLAFFEKDVNAINEVLRDAYLKKDLYMFNYANMYKGLILRNKKIIKKSLDVFEKMRCLPDLQIFKNRIYNIC